MELFGREAPTNMPMDLIEPIEVVLFGGQQTEVEEASQNYESIEDEGPESKLHAEFYHYSIAFSSETPLKQHCHARRGKYNIQNTSVSSVSSATLTFTIARTDRIPRPTSQAGETHGAREAPPIHDETNWTFYPVDNYHPRPFLAFARFDDDPELLSSIQDLDIPLLKNAVWRPNSDGELCGGFGYVERASWNNQEVAVKFLRGPQAASGQARGKRSFRRELIAWKQLDHPNILPFLGVVCVDNMYLGMVSPYMTNGSARSYITKNLDANVLQILYDVAAGLRYLAAQSPPIAHGDLKGANVLIDEDGRARICDFGLSKFIKEVLSIDTRCGGTTRWMAPEQILSEAVMVSLSADIFSWGMTALEAMTGTAPWPEVQQDQAVGIKVAVYRERPARPQCESQQCRVQNRCACLRGDDALWALIEQCWRHDPNERPSAAQLCGALAQNPGVKSHV